jgi:hypothetical protein
MRNIRFYLLAIAAFTFCSANLAFADLVFLGPVDIHGTGFGTVGPIMTMQTTGQGGAGTDEQGCSGWNGTAVIIGASACAPAVVSDDETQPAYTGADSKGPAHFPHNDSPTLSSLGITNAEQIAIIFNPDQSGKDHPITLNDLTITLWSSTGTLIWNSGDITGGNTNNGDSDLFAHTDSGVGKSGIVYVLDSTQAAALDAMNFDFTTTHIGLSAFATGATGGPDSFSVVERVVPEPSFFFVSLAGFGLFVTMTYVRRRRA